MKLLVLTSAALFGLAHSAPPSAQYHLLPHASPYLTPYSPVVSPLVSYHSDEEADCRQEIETVQVETCIPGYEIKCEDTEVTNSKVTYKKECKQVVDVACGSHKPVSAEAPADDNDEEKEEAAEADTETEEEASAQDMEAANEAIPAAIYSTHPATFYHNCYDVPREFCYVVPVITEEPATVEKCWVVETPKCHNSTLFSTTKMVCNHNDENEGEEMNEEEVEATRSEDTADEEEQAEQPAEEVEGAVEVVDEVQEEGNVEEAAEAAEETEEVEKEAVEDAAENEVEPSKLVKILQPQLYYPYHQQSYVLLGKK